jgi:hypothetical protein
VNLRPFVRAAPFVIGAVAAGVWLHQRRRLERPALREITGEQPPLVPPEPPGREPIVRRAIDIVTIVDDLLGAVR